MTTPLSIAPAAHFTADAERAADDRHEARIARTLVHATTDSDDVIYRPTWPSDEVAAQLNELAAGSDDGQPAIGEAALTTSSWLDSMRALRDGLSVVEVFAPPEEADPTF